MLNAARLDRAIRFAAKAHEGQLRKTEKVPYITHPYTAAMYVLAALTEEIFPDEMKESIVIATLLHDVWEDTTFSLADIEKEFGKEVAFLVEQASEPDKSLSWRERKEHTIRSLKNAPLSVRYVVCADKTHNLVSLKNDYQLLQEKIWESFKGDRNAQQWYYRSIADALLFGLESPPPFFLNYKRLVNEFFSD